jgi:hypothetical protein
MTAQLALLLVTWADKVPDDKDVKAGWGAFGIFIALAVAVAVLGWSLTKHLRKAERNAEAGVFDASERNPRRTSI